MLAGATKHDLRVEFLKPKDKLRGERNRRRWTTSYVGAMVGLSRRQYELKEKGMYPFNDYEMLIIARAMNIPVGVLFFES